MVSFSYKLITLSFIFVVIAFDKVNALKYQDKCVAIIADEICDKDKGLQCKPSIPANGNDTATEETCQCIANSEFDFTKQKCQCNRGYIEKDQICEVATSIGRICTLSKGCNSSQLFCDPEFNTCSCSLNYATSPGKDNCFLRIGTSCADKGSKDLECGENKNVTQCSNITKNICLCKQGYIPNFSLTNCYREFNHTCTENNGMDECNRDQGLSCINGKCNCTLTVDQIYDEKKQICVSKETKRCTVDSKTLQCETDSQCERYNANSMYGLCKKSTTSIGSTHSLFYPLFLITVPFYIFTFLTS